MPLTVRNVADDLLGYLQPEQRVYPPDIAKTDDPLPSVLTAIHEALTEISTLGPAWYFKSTRSDYLRAPTVVNVGNLAVGADSFTLSVPQWQDWMLGCTIKLSNQAAYNQIKGRSGDTVTLLYPVSIAGTAITATVYHDCLNPAGDVLEILANITIPDCYNLVQVGKQPEGAFWAEDQFGSRDINDLTRSHHGDYGRSQQTTFDTNPVEREFAPAPYFFQFESLYEPGSIVARRIRMTPLPTGSNPIVYGVRLAPPRYTRADIFNPENTTADPGTPIPLSDRIAGNIFTPIARKRFMASPVFASDSKAKLIDQGYETAYEIIEKMQPTMSAGFNIQEGW